MRDLAWQVGGWVDRGGGASIWTESAWHSIMTVARLTIYHTHATHPTQPLTSAECAWEMSAPPALPPLST